MGALACNSLRHGMRWEYPGVRGGDERAEPVSFRRP
jgi:hypothetical protein